MVIQLPPRLPIISPVSCKAKLEAEKDQEPKDEEDKIRDMYFPCPEDIFVMKNATEGLLGQLLVHESGNMSLKIGNHDFIVQEGFTGSILRQIYSMSKDRPNGKFGCVGKIVSKLILVPDFEKTRKITRPCYRS
uniref:DNA-directed RNA polymerase III subunit RPC4 (Trinotate prediction) n=1 Tax=Myxobolus squamalis TaxID=59785 RepID=A0A6B2FZL2_MYXSQ